jgi:hypothetical protein
MVDALTLDDVDGAGNGSCVHARLELVASAVNSFMTNPPPNATQRVDVQLRNHLQTAAGRALTVNQVERALQLWLSRR